ncbi:unnamed protein product [Leuciscus chuanchicus]
MHKNTSETLPVPQKPISIPPTSSLPSLRSMINLRVKGKKSPCACWERSEEAWKKLSARRRRVKKKKKKMKISSRHQRCQHHDTPQETPSLSGPYVDAFGPASFRAKSQTSAL